MKGAALTLCLKPSGRLAAAVAAVHGLACAAVLRADLAWGYRTPLLAAVGIGFVAWWQARKGELTVRCETDGRLSVLQGDDWLAAVVLPETLVWPWLVVLRYRLAETTVGRVQSVLVDCLDPDDFRRLRIWLRWRAAGRAPPLQASTQRGRLRR